MQLYEMQVNKTTVFATAPVRVPKGIMGAVVKLSFSEEWKALNKTVVFRAGTVSRDVLDVQEFAVIPAECTREEGELLQLGIYGVDAEGAVAIPTLWATIGRIVEAADPSGDTSTDPTLPVWAQLQEKIRQLEEQGVTQNEVEQAVKDFFGGTLPAGRTTAEGGEIFNFYTDPVYTGDNPPKEYPGNTAAKGSHAQNFGTHADGEYSSASGWNSTASGGIAHAEGRETVASGYAAHAEGFKTTASGKYAHAEGEESVASQRGSHAQGYRVRAEGNYSHAEGRETESTKDSSHAEGRKTKATGNYAHAEGNESIASGTAAHAEGIRTEAIGQYTHAEGFETKAAGVAAHAEGVKTEASGYASHAQGYGTITTCRGQTVQGKFNVPDTPLDSDGNGTYAHIVGWGSGDTSRKNIYTLDTNGNAEFAGKVYSGGKELALSEDTANKKRLKVPAGGSAKITLDAKTTYLVSASDNARQGCVLLQALDRTISTKSNVLMEAVKWTYSADGLDLTISETGGLYDLWISVVSL